MSPPALGARVLLIVGSLSLQPALAQQAQLPPLPLTQLDDRALAADLDNRAFTLTFTEAVSIRDLLLMLVRGTSLSVVPDPDITGTFVGDLKNVTVRQALGLVLPPIGLDYSIDGSFVRVFRRERETRLYDVNFSATSRSGTTTVGGGAGNGSSSVRVTGTTTADVFEDLVKGVQSLLSDKGTYSVDRKAGLVQVTDFSERLERVATYLDAVRVRVHRQVQIDARVLEIELNDAGQRSIDWTALVQPPGSVTAISTDNLPAPVTLRIADPQRFLASLAAQGKVTVLTSTRVVALNNEPAVVRTVVETTSEKGDATREHGVTIGVTPQIGSDGVVMLSLSPLVALQDSDVSGRPLPVTTVREADMLTRVRDGETVVVAGLSRERETRERKNVGAGGGWFGRSTVVSRKHVELVILLTPKILAAVGEH